MPRILLGVFALVLTAVASCSSDDDTGKTGTGGSSGSGGSSTGGTGGTATGGSGGTSTGGSAGTATGGTGGTSTGGSAGSATGGSAGATAGCPTDPGAADGQPCSEEGKVCGDCSDPCQFCNLLKCENGKWTHMEVFPAPCDGG